MTYLESYETFDDAGKLAEEVIHDVWVASLFSMSYRHKVIIEAAEDVFSRKFPDYTGLKTRLSELPL